MTRRFFSPEQAAAELDVSISTIRNYLRDGRLEAKRIRGSRFIRIPVEALDALLEDRSAVRNADVGKDDDAE